MTLEHLLNLVEQGFLERGRGVSMYCASEGYSADNIDDAELVLYGVIS